MAARTPVWTWQTISRIIGLVIIIALLATFMVAFITAKPLNSSLTLAFLGVASGLIGLPSGWQLIRRNGASRNGPR